MNARRPLFLLVVLSGIFLLSPFLNVQPLLSQGDHGRDLYAFEQTLYGAKPYQDYWWVYGPLMPYYYAVFFKFFGINVASILLGKMILNLCSGVFLYWAMGAAFGRALGFLTALWFWSFNPDFFFTYNHAGGITLMTLILAVVFSYLKNVHGRALWAGLAAAFLLSFVKLNIGLAFLAAFLLSIFLMDLVYKIPWSKEKKWFYVTGLLVVPAVICAVYWALLKGLTVAEIRQCLPYLKGDQPYSIDPFTPFKILWDITINNIRFTWTNTISAGLVLFSLAQCFWLLGSRGTDKALKEKIFLTLSILGIFFLAGIHEFVMSGVFYRYFWTKPFQIAFLAAVIAFAVKNLPLSLRMLLGLCLIFVVAQEAKARREQLQLLKTHAHYLDLPRLKIFTNNPPDWYAAVKDTAVFLDKNLKPRELFFALPYDPLYYYLAGKKAPTRQLIFFDHIHIPPAQEESVIAELEKNQTHYVLLSSRMAASEYGLGVLGVNYCPLIARYLNERFEAVAKFGDWRDDPGWAWHHGTMILKRKNPL